MLFAVVTTACFVPGLLLRYGPFSALLTAKQKLRLAACYGLMGIANAAVLYFVPHAAGGVAMQFVKMDLLAFGIITTVINILLIPGHFREHMFVYGVVTTCNYLIVSIPTAISATLVGLDDTLGYSVNAIMYIVLVAICYHPMRRLLRNTVEPFLTLECDDYWGTTWFIPTAIFLAIYIAFPGDYYANSINSALSGLLIGSAMILICYSIAADHQRLRDKKVMEKQLIDQKLHYAEMKAHVEDARKTRHDFKHYLAAVQHFIDTDDKSGLQNYCDDLIEKVNVDIQIPYTGNTAVDGVLYRYARLARENNIKFEYNGSFKSDGIADMDMCVLLGNALENALQGCKTVDNNRFILLAAETKGQMFSVVVSNSFDGVVLVNSGALLSRKRHNEPGIGIESMRTVCKRYDGSLQFQNDESVFYLTAMLLMNK